MALEQEDKAMEKMDCKRDGRPDTEESITVNGNDSDTDTDTDEVEGPDVHVEVDILVSVHARTIISSQTAAQY